MEFGWDDTRCFKSHERCEIEDDAFKHEAIIHSMTPSERSKPSLIDVKRKARISKGSGTKIEQVNQLMKFEQMSKMMKMMQGPGGKTS
jgi:signal recognition particle subunit SRP54